MLIAFFRISRCRLRYSISLCCCRISAAIWAGLCSCALISADGCRLRYCFFHRFRLYSLTSSSPATCRCVFPPWITSSTAWRLNSSLYLRAILLFTVAFILLCAPVSAQLGEVQHLDFALLKKSEELLKAFDVGARPRLRRVRYSTITLLGPVP